MEKGLFDNFMFHYFYFIVVLVGEEYKERGVGQNKEKYLKESYTKKCIYMYLWRNNRLREGHNKRGTPVSGVSE